MCAHAHADTSFLSIRQICPAMYLCPKLIAFLAGLSTQNDSVPGMIMSGLLRKLLGLKLISHPPRCDHLSLFTHSVQF